MAAVDERLPPIQPPWPCELVEAQQAGRYVITTAPVAAGAPVLEDAPFAAVVADPHRGYVCARCLHVCSTQVFQCGGCRQAHYCSQACLCQDAEAVHARGECRALGGLAKLGVEGDSQPMRLALRIVVVAAAATETASPFHTPAFVRGLDHHFDEAPPAVRQGVLAVAQALGTYMGADDGDGTIIHTITAPPVRPRQPACCAPRAWRPRPRSWRGRSWPSSATPTPSAAPRATCSGSGM